MEMDNISSLNPATYKVDHAIRFILLDDAVLVARKRKRRNNAETDKLVAERCWPLNEMLVLDTKDTASESIGLIMFLCSMLNHALGDSDDQRIQNQV